MPMPPGKRLLVLGAILTMQASGAAASSPLWGSLQKGTFDVGFSVTLLHDSSRVLPGSAGPRPIQLCIWYPGNGGNVTMTYRDYVVLTGLETGHDIPGDSVIARYKGVVTSNGVPADAFDRWMSSPLVARRDATPAPGPFPLVLIAQGNYHSPHHQAILAEFLASHGFVVATSPSQTRLGSPLNSEDDILPNMEEQVADLLFILRRLKTRADADTAQIVLVGHSFGGRSAAMVPVSVPDIRAIVSLDGGIGIEPATTLFFRYPGFCLSGITAPILHLYETTDPFIKPDLSLLRSLNASDRYLMHIPGFHHYYFSSLGMVAGVIPGFTPDDQEKIRKNYEACCSLTLSFLTNALDSSWTGALIPVEQAGISLEHLPPGSEAERLVQTEKDFAAMSVKQGTRPAFLAFLSDDGIVFRPHPVNGKSVIAARPNPAITLDWVPSRAEASGGLGYTTGPWVLRFNGDQSKPPLYGNYFSVWREDSTRHWKLILDLGTSNEKPLKGLGEIATVYPDREPPSGARSAESLMHLDRELSDASEQRGAYSLYAADDVRILRDGIEPVTGIDSMELRQERVSVEPAGGGISSNNELGYTYGTYATAKPEHGYYVHVWRRVGTSFRLVVDLLSSLPEE
jgi:dienelactone hydrolase